MLTQVVSGGVGAVVAAETLFRVVVRALCQSWRGRSIGDSGGGADSGDGGGVAVVVVAHRWQQRRES